MSITPVPISIRLVRAPTAATSGNGDASWSGVSIRLVRAPTAATSGNGDASWSGGGGWSYWTCPRSNPRLPSSADVPTAAG